MSIATRINGRLQAFAILSNRNFAYLLAGQLISQVGDWTFSIAQAWWVWSLTGSAAAAATVSLCGQVPRLAFALWGGVLVDRLPRRQILFWSDLLRGLVMMAVFALAATGSLQIWHFYLNSALFGIASAMFRPAFRAFIPTVVDKERRQHFNALVGFTRSFTQISGPLVGAMVVRIGGYSAAFLANGISFLMAAALTSMITVNGEVLRQARKQETKTSAWWADLKEGWRVVATTPVMLTGLTVMSLVNLSGMALNILLVPWVAKVHLGGSPAVLSMAHTSFAVGSLLTGMVLALVAKVRPRGPLAFGFTAVAGLMVALSAVVTAPWQLWVAQFLLGATAMVFGVIWEGVIQEYIPNDVMGRAAALENFLAMVLFPAGLAIGGYLSPFVGEQAVMVAGGLITALVAGASCLLRPIRQLV